MDMVQRIPEMAKNFRETKLASLRPPQEFFDHQRLSRPADMNECTSRLSYNTRYFSGNYGVIIAGLSVYALITNFLLLIAIGFLIGGFTAINKYAPEPMNIGEHVITQKTLYITLFVIGFPMLWLAAPLSTIFWIIGASSVLVLGHAALMEKGLESEYGGIEGGV